MLHQSAAVCEAVLQMTLAQAGGGGGGETPGLFGPQFIIMMIVIFGVMYFITIRPQAKREKERREMLDAIKKGDRVLSAGGIFGTVVGADSQKVVIRISEEPAVKIELLRSSVARVVNPEDEKADEQEDEEKE